MLQNVVIGNLGADAQVKGEQGREFVTFRVAHTDKWTDAAGQQHSETTWVDCVLNGKPKVFEYLKKGVQVCVIGTTSLRVYSSAKDRCMKAGVQVNVRSIELLGGSRSEVPSRLYDANGVQVDVTTFYHVTSKDILLYGANGAQYSVDSNGWVTPMQATENAGEEQQPAAEHYDGF